VRHAFREGGHGGRHIRFIAVADLIGNRPAVFKGRRVHAELHGGGSALDRIERTAD
jgi:hypothetical protein